MPAAGDSVPPASASAVTSTDEPGPRHRQLWSMLKVGVIGFGGGSALIPVMERELVGRHGGLDEPTFVKDTVIANITPGTLPVKLAVLSGFQLGGAWSALTSALVVALPGTAATVGLIASFAALGPGAISLVEQASLGVTAFIIFLLGHYVVKVLRPGGYWRASYVTIAVLAFLATGGGAVAGLWLEITGSHRTLTVPHLSALGLIVTSLATITIGSIVQWWRQRRGKSADAEPPANPAAAPQPTGASLRGVVGAIVATVVIVVVGFALALLIEPPAAGLEFMGLITFSTISSFGGGEAYVGVADGFFVQAGWVDEELYYGQIVPVANALPGPILVKIAAGIAYGAGLELGGALLGWLLALAVYLATIGSCCAVALAVLAGYDKARDSVIVRNIASFILPVICGLLATTSVSMLHASGTIAAKSGAPPVITVLGSIAVAVLLAVLHRKVKVPDVVAILACAALSLGILQLVAA